MADRAYCWHPRFNVHELGEQLILVGEGGFRSVLIEAKHPIVDWLQGEQVIPDDPLAGATLRYQLMQLQQQQMICTAEQALQLQFFSA